METTWEIVKNFAGQFEIFRNGELHSTVNGSQLERQLAPHGIILVTGFTSGSFHGTITSPGAAR